MEESRLELKVGALVLTALVSGALLLALMGEFSFGSAQTVLVHFGHTGNVVKGAPVKMGGIPVGRVDRVDLDPERRDVNGEALPVTMTLSVSPQAASSLKTDAMITVSSQGPLGEPYLELAAGTATSPLPAGKPIRAIDAPRMDMVANRLASFLDAAGKVLDKDPQAFGDLIIGMASLTRTVDGVLTENRGELRQTMVEMTTAVKELRALASQARTQLEPGGKGYALLDDGAAVAKAVRNDWPALSREANTSLSALAAVTGPLKAEDGEKLKAALTRYSAAGEKLDRVAERADRLLAKLEAGEGTLGASLKDRQVYDDLKTLLAELRKHPWKLLWKD